MDGENHTTIVGEFTDFFASAPTLGQIVAYTLPDDLQTRAHELLDKNRNQKLSDDEQAEMEQFRYFDHLLALIKTRAYIRLKKQ